MEYVSLYRKYRPKKFADVVGQEVITTILKNSIKNKKISNAYIFAGTKGTGKTSIAKIFANSLNCLHNDNGDICGKCEVCLDFANNNIVDVFELDAASNNGVDEIRKINDNIHFLPAKLSKKVYIIDEAHMLTTGAWNALLKTIEEPPAHVLFIFATTEIHKIPTTIISRCQCFRFTKIAHQPITDLLKSICELENIKYEFGSLNTLCNISDGSIRDALSSLEQVAIYTDNNITIDSVYQIYGLLKENEIISFLNTIAHFDNTKASDLLNNYFISGINFSNFCSMIISILTDKIIYLRTKNEKLLTRTNIASINSLEIDDQDKIIKLLDLWQDVYFKINVPTDLAVSLNYTVLKSLEIFKEKNDSNIFVKKSVEAPVKILKQTKMEEIKEEQPVFPARQSVNFDKMFKFEEIKSVKETTKLAVKTVVKEQPLVKFDQEKIVSSIISNSNAKFIKIIKDFIADLQSGKIIESKLSPMSSSKKVLWASQNGAILLFEDEIDAKILNEALHDKDFILSCCKMFEQPLFIFGFTTKQINDRKEAVQAILKNKTSMPEPDLAYLRKILNDNESIEQIAYNTVFKFLKKE